MTESNLQWKDNMINFDSAAQKAELGSKIIMDISEWFKKRSQLEIEYAKKVTELGKTKPGASLFSKEVALLKENKTIKAATFALFEKEVTLSDKKAEFGNKILNEICKTLDNWVKQKDVERKRITTEGSKFLKVLVESKQNALKSRTNYENAMKESDSAKDELLQAEKNEINMPEKKNLQQITRRASQKFNDSFEKGKKLELIYQSSVKKYNEELELYQTKNLPNILEQFQKLETERWNLLVESLKSYNTLQQDLFPSMEDDLINLTKIIEETNIEEDYKDFVEANIKETESLLQFVPYKSKYAKEADEKTSTPESQSSNFSFQTAEEKLSTEPSATNENSSSKEIKKSQKIFEDDE